MGSMRHSHSRSLTTTIVALLLVASACGGTTSSGTPTTGLHDFSDTSALVAAAKNEGTLTVYLPTGPPFDALVAGFKAQYPWAQVQVTGLNVPDIRSKVEVEGKTGVNNVDVYFTFTAYTAAFEKEKLLAQVKVENDALVPSSQLDPEYWAHVDFLSYSVIAHNTNLATAGPANYSELADPKWKGKIVLGDPTTGGGAALNLAGMRKTYGDAKWMQWLKDLATTSYSRPIMVLHTNVCSAASEPSVSARCRISPARSRARRLPLTSPARFLLHKPGWASL